MAEGLYLVRRTQLPGNGERNGVRDVLINNDDGDSDAVIMQNTVDALNAAEPGGGGHAGASTGEPAYPDGYFDTVMDVDDLAATGEDNLRTDGDFIAFKAPVTSVETAGV